MTRSTSSGLMSSRQPSSMATFFAAEIRKRWPLFSLCLWLSLLLSYHFLKFLIPWCCSSCTKFCPVSSITLLFLLFQSLCRIAPLFSPRQTVFLYLDCLMRAHFLTAETADALFIIVDRRISAAVIKADGFPFHRQLSTQTPHFLHFSSMI